MKVLIVDTETTGLDENIDEVLEIGMLLFESNNYKILHMENFFRVDVAGIETSDKTRQLTGILDWMLEKLGTEDSTIAESVLKMFGAADIAMAHNAQFDRKFLLKFLLQADVTKAEIGQSARPWIDTYTALPFRLPSMSMDSLRSSLNLSNLGAHRAMIDCLNLFEIVRMCEWEGIIERHASPVRTLVAKISYDAMNAMAEEDKPKSHGFKWDPQSKTWFKNVLEIDLPSQPKTKFDVSMDLI